MTWQRQPTQDSTRDLRLRPQHDSTMTVLRKRSIEIVLRLFQHYGNVRAGELLFPLRDHQYVTAPFRICDFVPKRDQQYATAPIKMSATKMQR